MHDHDQSTFGTHSCWMNVPMPLPSGELPRAIETDVCVVGAGIAGLTTAYLLATSGERVVVLDAGPIGGGETGRTTAQFVTALDDRYFELERLHGAAGARMLAESHRSAIDLLGQIVQTEKIDCGLLYVNGYLFLREGESRHVLERELDAARRAGVSVELMEHPPITPIAAGPALCFREQAQIHPLRYLAGLARAAMRAGAKIFTHHHVAHFEGHPQPHVITDDGRVVRCRALVVATNTPVNDKLIIHTKQSGMRTYVVALDQMRGAVPAAFWWDTGEGYHYVRTDTTTAAPDRQLLIVGGEDHRVGQDLDPHVRWDRLEAWARDRFPGLGIVLHRWSGQVMEPFDDVAFIGHNPTDAPGVFVITGDSGNGMTHCTIGGMMMLDMARGYPHPWAELYDPRRRTMRALPTYLEDAANTTAQYAGWLRGGDVSDVSKIPLGQGATVLEHGHRLAIYKDPYGVCHRMRAACTHLGGVVSWNHAERSWDCPVHGARYDPFGAVIMGPACEDLTAVESPTPDEAAPLSPMYRVAATPRF